MDCYEGNGSIDESDIMLTPNTVKSFICGYFTSSIKVRDNLVSYLCMPKEMENMNSEQLFLLDSVKIQIASAMERVVLVRDREAAKSETERERFKSNLLRAISHDIRTPLTRITGAAHMLQHNLGENDSIKLISGIYEDSTWLTHLVENILSLTRIQEGKLNIHIQSEAVEEIISGAISQTIKYAPDHKITITVPQEVLFVPMDGKLIEQVLINLINNAIEHTSPENEILVSVKPEADKVWFEVKDSGIGIDEKDLTNIFDMFYVSPNSRRDGKQGMGLGLAICKAIITYHGGNITASNNPEGGSTFRFYLNLSLNINADE
ncbi:MAG TPA: ATP-binding protein [Mobilitalea sp.]|nr:ATP-binding protein [Mobilitalea sp.]